MAEPGTGQTTTTDDVAARDGKGETSLVELRAQIDAADLEDFGVAVRSQWQLVLRRFLRHRLAVISLLVLVVIFVLSLFHDQVAGHPYRGVAVPDPSDLSQPPSLDHYFGTNEIGVDTFAQTMRGARLTIMLSVFVATLTTVLGTVIGLVQGWWRGRVDSVLGRVTDLFLIIPILATLLVLGSRVASSGGTGVWAVALILVLFSWMPLSRIVRAEVLSLREREFIEAARAIGASNSRILFRHLLPNTISSVIVYGTYVAAVAIILEASLSFLGLGIQLPEVSLGKLVDLGAEASKTRWWLFYLPGSMLIVIVLAVNFIGDGVRDAFDARQTQHRA